MFSKQFVKDAVERMVKTFVQVFGAALATGSVVDLSAAHAAVLAAGSAALSALTSMLSTNFGDPGTASALPAPKTDEG